MKDASERHSLETQISEFGQTPKQLFILPHPQRVAARTIAASTDLSSEPFSPVFTPDLGDLRLGENSNVNLLSALYISFNNRKQY